MIDRINNNQIQNMQAGAGSEKKVRPKAQQEQSVDASAQVNHQEFIKKAQNIQTNDAQKVAQAKELLLSGELDSIENIKKAAESIINFGI